MFRKITRALTIKKSINFKILLQIITLLIKSKIKIFAIFREMIKKMNLKKLRIKLKIIIIISNQNKSRLPKLKNNLLMIKLEKGHKIMASLNIMRNN